MVPIVVTTHWHCPRVLRTELLGAEYKLLPRVVALDDCISAHHWARQFQGVSSKCDLLVLGMTPLRKEQQELCERCRCDHRSGEQAGDALRYGESVEQQI